uniref:Phosphoribosylformylglycinamidine cyclo-ligase n=1 Tax=Sarcoptes scabiei TaxID=52283 RepID=A0A834RBI9_SARSC
MCINDILVQGAEPLFFLDYFACNRLKIDRAATIIKGIADGCLMSNCALIGGETAEMPGMYEGDDFDLAGFGVGIVERHNMLPRKESIALGDVVIGLSSSGIHSNGYSLVRKIMKLHSIDWNDRFDEKSTFKDVLMKPTKIYVESLIPVIRKGLIKALCHITGGGLIENIPRILPKKFAVELDGSKWNQPDIFAWLKTAGDVSNEEMLKTFNCGLGMVLIVGAEHSKLVQKMIEENGENSFIVGECEFKKSFAQKTSCCLDFWNGTNLKAIIDYVENNSARTTIDLALVISNKSTASGNKFALDAGIPLKVLLKKKTQSREEYDSILNETLGEFNIEIICLAGYMVMLSEEFVTKWLGRMINIHPSILPSFKGIDAYGQALDYGVQYTGCTVHFVVPEMDAGPIIRQGIVEIMPNETHDSLVERGKAVEHKIYAEALELVTSGKVRMSNDTKSIERL